MSPNGTSKQILYVEDSPVNATLIKEYVNHIDGAEITIAVTGEQGVEFAVANPPDLILMDINLPGMNGVDAMNAIREHGGELAEIPFIALSADAIDEEIQRAIDAGFDDYLTKPIFFAKLKEVLTHQLSLPES